MLIEYILATTSTTFFLPFDESAMLARYYTRESRVPFVWKTKRVPFVWKTNPFEDPKTIWKTNIESKTQET